MGKDKKKKKNKTRRGPMRSKRGPTEPAKRWEGAAATTTERPLAN